MEQAITFYQETPIQVRFNDADSFGHVNNTIIQEYFDLGRVFYFRAIFGKDIDWNNFKAIIASIKTDFLAQVFLTDELFVRTKIVKIGNKSLTVVQHLVDVEGEMKATCHSVMVGYDPATKDSVQISEEWRNQIKTLEKDLE